MQSPVRRASPSKPSSQNNSTKSLLVTVQELEKKQRELLSSVSQNDPQLIKLRESLREKYVALLLEDPDANASTDIEQHLWKNIFYKCIEDYRKALRLSLQSKQAGVADTKRIAAEFSTFLDSATSFYEHLLSTFSSRCNLELSAPHAPEESTHKRYYTAFRILICLGDILRYRRDIPSSNSGENMAALKSYMDQARKYYEQAHLLMPANGNTHNQLAVLRSYAEDDWGAVYHYYRAMTVSSPFQTACSNVAALLQKVVVRFQEGKLRSTPAESSSALQNLKYYVVLHAFLFLGRIEEFDANVGTFVSTLSDNLAASNISHEDAVELVRMIVGCMFYPYHVQNPSAPAILSSRPEEVMNRAVMLALELIRSCIETFLSTRAPLLLAPISVGLLWLEHNTNLITLRSGVGDDAKRFGECLSKLPAYLSLGPATSDAPPLPEDVDLNGFLPLSGHFEAANYALPPISDPPTVFLRRSARVSNFVRNVAPNLSWAEERHSLLPDEPLTSAAHATPPPAIRTDSNISDFAMKPVIDDASRESSRLPVDAVVSPPLLALSPNPSNQVRPTVNSPQEISKFSQKFHVESEASSPNIPVVGATRSSGLLMAMVNTSSLRGGSTSETTFSNSGHRCVSNVPYGFSMDVWERVPNFSMFSSSPSSGIQGRVAPHTSNPFAS